MNNLSFQVHFVGQLIAGVLAKDEATARRAAKLVKVYYEELEPIFTIQVCCSLILQ